MLGPARSPPSFLSAQGCKGCEIREILLAGILFRGPTIHSITTLFGKGTWLHENCSV